MIPDRRDSSKIDKSQLRESVLSSRLGIESQNISKMTLTLTALEVIVKDMNALTVEAVIFNDDAGASHHFSGIPLLVDLAETNPDCKLLGVRNFDKVYLMFSAESLNEFNVFGFRAGLDKDTKMGRTSVQGFCAFTQTSNKAIMGERNFQNLLVLDMD